MGSSDLSSTPSNKYGCPATFRSCIIMFIKCDRSLRDATNYVKCRPLSHRIEVVHQHVLVQLLLQMRHSDVQNGLRFRLTR